MIRFKASAVLNKAVIEPEAKTNASYADHTEHICAFLLA